MSAYSVQVYYNLQDQSLLQKKLDNIKLLAKLEISCYERLKMWLENPELGKKELEKRLNKIQEYKQDATNIVLAMELLKQPDIEEDDEEEENE